MSFAQTRSVPSGLDKCHDMCLESRRLNVVCEISSHVWHSKFSVSFCSHSPSQALLWFVEAIAQNYARTGQTPGNINVLEQLDLTWLMWLPCLSVET